MSIGYMGYVKMGGTTYLATSANVAEVITPIYSNAARGAGWKTSGTAFYSDDIFQYEGNVDFELVVGMWATLRNWIIETRTTPTTMVISPDGSNVYTFTAAPGSMAGLYNSSANFSTSEGSFVTCSVGVLGITRVESQTQTYILNTTGQTFVQYEPLAYWQSSVTIGGSALPAGTTAIDWSVDISNNPTVVYGCKGTKGPVAIMMGEVEVTANVVLFNPDGVAAPSLATQALAISTGGGTLTLPKALADNDSNDLSGNDSIISRAYSFKGLASSGKSPIEMSA
jgi:hypothetical protein